MVPVPAGLFTPYGWEESEPSYPVLREFPFCSSLMGFLPGAQRLAGSGGALSWATTRLKRVCLLSDIRVGLSPSGPLACDADGRLKAKRTVAEPSRVSIEPFPFLQPALCCVSQLTGCEVTLRMCLLSLGLHRAAQSPTWIPKPSQRHLCLWVGATELLLMQGCGSGTS